MKVIAIKDANFIPNGIVYRGKTFYRAYVRGDVFDISPRDYNHPRELIIHHPLIDDVMICNRSNFMQLEEFRNSILEQLEI